jgi:very-short-patch-repair endonuclease
MLEAQPVDFQKDVRRIVDAARGVWMRRLIDHSRRNSLLFFRDLKVGTLDLTEQPDAVSQLLAGESLQADDLIIIDLSDDTQDAEDATKCEGEALKRVRSGLIALSRKALGNLEEKGIETLHLAIGMATWPSSDGGSPYNAPILLVPARIEMRGRAGNDIRLLVLGEPQLNPVLLYVLEESYAVRIDAASLLGDCVLGNSEGKGNNHSECKIDPKAVYARIQLEAKPVPHFAIRPRVVLGNFQFAKLAMVEDLKRNAETIAASPIIAAVAGHSGSREKLGQAVDDVELSKLDERSADSDYLVLDADSTQHRVIVVVGRGQNGVIQGPPGTGKSQTIANVIAQSVSEGRRVLFVAEKRAALDAVIKRLNHPDIELGHLVLDLHGASVSRKEVMARIAHALNHIRQSLPTDGAEAVHQKFEARRKELNEHAVRVNLIRPPTGFSINQMIGNLFRLPPAAKSEFRLRGEKLLPFTPERTDQIKQWIREGAANPALLLGTDPSPWNNADIKNGQQAQEAIDLARRTASELWPQFERLLGIVVCKIGVRPPATLDHTRQLIELLSHARQIREEYDPQVFSENLSELAGALEPAIRSVLARGWAFLTNKAYRSARKRLRALRLTKAAAPQLRQDVVLALDLCNRWQKLGATSVTPTVTDSDTELSDAFTALGDAAKALAMTTGADPFSNMPTMSVALWLSSLASDQRTPFKLPGMYAIRLKFAEAGIDGFLEDLRASKASTDYWAARFDYIWLHSALDQVLASDPAVAAFNGRTHEELVQEFCHLDRERIRLAASRVRRLHAERAIDAMNQNFAQTDLVRAEAAKKTRHIPIRELLARAPEVLTRISPCWVASPLSVSQLLDGAKRHFDIVVFDEASQILQEEAIPALYRAEKVVVAGDRHQLPPTTFFATTVEGEDDDSLEEDQEQQALATATAAIGGYESLLGTLEAFLPNWLLEWHYRSEDERLITFSNTNIYSGRLITFPSARGQEAIRHILVPHDPSLGTQEESASREVEVVVREVLRHAETRPRESLGVITMGIKHANRVQAALDRALDDRPDLADFFTLAKEERFFVKNLETVQGDERDAIILSVGYGKSSNGDLPHRFGPLSQDVGYRRLNVAVTRAKRRMCVISSFSWGEIDLNRSGSRGVQLLKAYLEYAANGGTRLPQGEDAGGELNAFEADIRDALEGKGINIRPQFGASRYRIDLVAMHPQKHGRPVLAIECDGASYHSSATARDRDRLRQSHLQRLGWKFHRIWSTDWFYSREQETERARAAYEGAVRLADASDTNPELDPPSDTTIVIEDDEESTPPSPPPGPRDRGPKPQVPDRPSIEDYRDSELLQLAKWVVSDGQLRTNDELIHEILHQLPFKKMGGRIKKRLEKTAKAMLRKQNT